MIQIASQSSAALLMVINITALRARSQLLLSAISAAEAEYAIILENIRFQDGDFRAGTSKGALQEAIISTGSAMKNIIGQVPYCQQVVSISSFVTEFRDRGEA